MSEVSDETINPPRYKRGGMECIDVIEAFGLGFLLGNAVKYILRCGFKKSAKTIDDLEKAKWYIERAIVNELKVK